MASTRRSTVTPVSAERQVVADILRSAVGQGILSLEEFESRLDAAYSAETVAELEELVTWVPTPQRASSRPRRLRIMAGVVAATAAVLVALATAARNDAGVDVPVITKVTQSGALATNRVTVVHVTWPRGTHDGYVESGDGDAFAQGELAPRLVDSTLRTYPVSYRVVACRSACRRGDPSAELVYGAWYRPKVGAALTAPPPALSYEPAGPSPKAGLPPLPPKLVIRAGAHADAAIVVFRDGRVVRLVTEQPVDGLVRLDEPALWESTASPSAQASYSVAACYSDCSPVSIDRGFAQITAKSGPVVVPAPAP